MCNRPAGVHAVSSGVLLPRRQRVRFSLQGAAACACTVLCCHCIRNPTLRHQNKPPPLSNWCNPLSPCHALCSQAGSITFTPGARSPADCSLCPTGHYCPAVTPPLPFVDSRYDTSIRVTFCPRRVQPVLCQSIPGPPAAAGSSFLDGSAPAR